MGLSNFTADGKLLETFCGSSSYAAPEMFLCRRYKGPEGTFTPLHSSCLL
jgi:hypothetical protein